MFRYLSIRLLFVSLFFCVSCQENRPEIRSDLGEARHAMMTRDYLEAEKSFERYLRRTPEGADRWEVWNSLVEIALSVRDDRKAAVELMEAMLIEYEDSAVSTRQIKLRLAAQYRAMRKYERALFLWSSVAEDANAETVDRVRACRGLANIYMRRLEFEFAKESLSYCLGLKIPNAVRAECLYDLAQANIGMGDAAAGITYFWEVLALSDIPESTATLTIFMLADALEQENDPGKALELFKSIANRYPSPKVVEMRIAGLEQKKPKK